MTKYDQTWQNVTNVTKRDKCDKIWQKVKRIWQTRENATEMWKLSKCDKCDKM